MPNTRAIAHISLIIFIFFFGFFEERTARYFVTYENFFEMYTVCP